MIARYDRDWYGTELTKEGSELFKDYLRLNDIYFETSQADNLIHFECFMTMEELYFANKWIDERFE